MGADSWFHSLWKPSKKHEHGPEKAHIGVLVFEVASVMSRLVHQLYMLTDKQVMKTRDEISDSLGIKKLISDDEDCIVNLICAEMLHNLDDVAKTVTRLSSKCKDPVLKCFERAYTDLVKHGADQYQWQFTDKKMSGTLKKMESFISVNASLYQEMESLVELEQILKRFKSNDDHESITVVEYTKKMSWKQQEVKRLKGISLWNKTYDYVVLLLARTVFTIFAKIGHVFGIGLVLPKKIHESAVFDSVMLEENYPEKIIFASFLSGPLGNIGTKSGPIPRTGKVKKCYSGPLGKSNTVSSAKTRNSGSFSGSIGKLTLKSGPLKRFAKTGLKWLHARDNSSKIHGKSLTPIHMSANSGPFGGPMMGQNESPVKTHHVNPTTATSDSTWRVQDIYGSKQKLFEAPPETLGGVALALHYANLIVVLEKLVASPHLIGHDARDDLYNMLPKNVKNALRVRLKPYAKSLASSPFDTGLAEEWTEAMIGILDWLSPLAHNTIRWQAERSFEHPSLVSRTNVVLVQTLHYANQEKVEATITELLVGLNYIWRFSREVNAKALLECENGVEEYVNLA